MSNNLWKLFFGLIFLSLIFASPLAEKVIAQTWTDNSLSGGEPIRTIHFRELRRAVYNKKNLCGMTTGTWTDPNIIPRSTPVRITHITELRNAISEIHTSGTVSRPAPTFTDVNLVPGVTPIRATHLTELRTTVSVATCCGDGTCDAAYEDGTNCPTDCVCNYGPWTGDSANCGDNLCEPIEVYQVKTSAVAGCGELTRCIQDTNVCCTGTYGSWVYFDCGGGNCDPTAERYRRISAVQGCQPEYQCGANESCCGWGTPVFVCGYGGYPPTSYVRVTTPANPACSEEVMLIENDSPFCCDYPATWTDLGCGATFEGTTYPATTHLQVKIDNNGVCDSELDITEDALALCCNYPATWTDLGCDIIFEGVTYPLTTRVEVKIDADGNCDSLVQTTENDIANCCDYPATWADLGCGVTFNSVSYAPTEHVEVRIDGNGKCDPLIQVTEDQAFCCDYPASWTDMGCGATYDGTTYLGTTSLRVNPDNNGVCDTLIDTTANDPACCDYPGSWTDLGCGATYDGTTYPPTTRVEVRVDNNGVCADDIQLTLDVANCCDYNTIDGCGLTIDGTTYPPTTWVEAEVDSFAVCPTTILQEIPNATGVCCSMGSWSDLGCGVTYDGTTYPPTTRVRIRYDSWSVCAPEIQVIPNDPVNCCSYPASFTDMGCHVTFEGTTYLPTSRIEVKVDGGATCPSIVNETVGDPTCCDYPATWTEIGCGVTYYGTTYPPTVRVQSKEDNNSICSPQIDAVTDTAYCCDYPATWTDMGCGITYDGTTYPVTTRVEVKVDNNGNCPDQAQITPNDIANCCDYPATWTDMGCGATFEGTTYPSTTHLQVMVDGFGVCDSQIDVTSNATGICCNFPATWTDMGCGATFMGTTYPSTTSLKVKVDTMGNCNPQIDVTPSDYATCCSFPGTWTDMGCGATFEGTTYPELTHLEVMVDGSGNCPSQTQVTPNDYTNCCTYPANYTDFGCGATNGSYSCPIDEMLLIKIPTPASCPIVDVGCSTDVSWGCYMCAPPGNTWDCTPVGDPCSWVKTCLAGSWSTCQQVSICTPGLDYNCTPNPDGFVDKKTCNACGDGYSPCSCTPEEIQTCTTGSGCPGIGTCSGGVWTPCEQENIVCAPGQQTACTTGGGYPGAQTCNACGDNWGACECRASLQVACVTGGGCNGFLSCNTTSGGWEGCVQNPAPECTPGEEQTCGVLKKKTCDSCGMWGACKYYWL
ncbi:MAG: hypothetical protein K8S27_06630 [Candidatus Omnitrophica bacterium]|nr:hypothetical protein [Candidatus Omnitrophota bacterium]